MKIRLFGPLAAALALAALTSVLREQENCPTGPSKYETNLQIFASTKLNLDNMSATPWSCYYC